MDPFDAASGIDPAAHHYAGSGGVAGLGRLEVVCGGMFSGKSEELIRRLQRAARSRRRVLAFKPALDDRYGGGEDIVSHSALRVQARAVRSTREIARILDLRTEVIGIDEVQFFDAEIVEFCERLANLGRRVIVAGLDLDYRAAPFEAVSRLMAAAEHVTKLVAVCAQCGGPARYSQRLVHSVDRVVVGAADAYEARCRRCFEPDASRQLAMRFDVTVGEEAPTPEEDP